MKHTRPAAANGHEAGSSSESEGSDGVEVSLEDGGWPGRALAALNALRKSRQHYDVVVVAGGAELAAHRAVLVAASPYLLEALGAPAPGPAPAHYRLEGVTAAGVRALLDYVYTGRLVVRDVPAARDTYRAACALRVEAARAHLADVLLRRLTPHHALEARALPALEDHHRAALDSYLANNFEEVCESGALAALPQIEIQLMRESSAADGAEGAAAVADAALEWLRGRGRDLDELCARAHLLYVDARGALRDCGELPAARGDAPELEQYRAQAAAEGRRVSPARASPPAGEPPCAVVAARRGAGGATRALVALRGRLAAARVAWSDVAAGGGGVARGGALGARDAPEGERRARLAAPRCAHGAVALHARLVVCGGYDRARVLRSAEVYCPATNAWAPLAEMRGPRARFAAARLGEGVWAVGGSDGHAELDSVEVLEGGAWRAGARLPLAVSHAALAADEAAGALYLLGGWAAGGTLRSVLRYTAAQHQWTDAPPLTTGRAQCGGVWWCGAVWALGGCDAWHCLASTERLEARGQAWEPGPALPTARRSMGACEWRGALVAAGGSDGAASLRRADWLAPGAAAWRPGPPMRRARAGLALVALRPALYAVGGFDGKEFLACVECLYEPDGEWTALCDPQRPTAGPPEEQTERNGESGPAP